MSVFVEMLSRWQADYYLLASLLLVTALGLNWSIAQPARRVALTRATLAGLVLLAMLCALPGWSVVHLMTREASPSAAAMVAPEIESESISVEAAPIEAPAEEMPAAMPAVMNPPSAVPVPGTTRLSDLVVWAYLAGSLLVIAWQVLGNWRARVLMRRARPAPPELQELLVSSTPATYVTGSLACRRARLLTSPTLPTAVALGIVRPTILLPQQLVDAADPTALRTILAHELAHIRHGDLRLLALCRGLFVLLWANPLFWLLRRRLRLDQETLADAAAAQVTTRHQYAEQLVDWAKRFAIDRPPALAAAVGLWESPSQLRRRVAVLLDERFTIWRECSYVWRAASNCVALGIAIGLSLITLAGPQAEPLTNNETSVFQLGMHRLGVLPGRVVAAQPVVAWQFDSVPEPGRTHRPALGQLAVSGELVYGSDGFGRLFAIDAPTGQRAWLYETNTFGRTEQPLIEGGIAYYATDSGIVALSSLSGGFEWQHDIPFGGAAECSPILANGRLFVTGYDGFMRALDAKTGNLLWQCDLLVDAPDIAKGDRGEDARFQEIKARPVTPASDGEVIYQPIFDQMRIVAVDCKSGIKRWSFETKGWMKGNPVVSDGRVYFGSQDRHLYCVDTATGKEIWKFAASSRIEAGAAVLDGRLYFGCCAGIVYCVDCDDGAEVWRFSLDKTNNRSPVYCSPLITTDGDLYIAGMEGQVYCLDSQSGKLKWKIRPSDGSEIDSHLATDGQRLFITTRTVNDNNLETGEVAIFALGSTEKQSEGSDSTSSTFQQAATTAANVATANTPANTPSDKSQANTITGRCVDEQGQPLGGVKVALFSMTPNLKETNLVSELTTGADGTFRFEQVVDIAKEYPKGLPERFPFVPRLIYTALARSEGRATAHVSESLERVARSGHSATLRMPPAATLRGKVTGIDGKPIPGVQVSAGLMRLPAEQRVFSAVTDQDGHYEIGDLEPLSREAEQARQEKRLEQSLAAKSTATGTFVAGNRLVTFSHPDYAIKRATYDEVPGEIDVQLQPAAVIDGRVTDASGKPVAEALVRLMSVVRQPIKLQGESKSIFERLAEHYQAQTRTDAEGHYRFDSVPANDYRIRFEAPELVTRGVDDLAVKTGEHVTLEDTKMTTGGRLRIQCIDAESGEPIAAPKESLASISDHWHATPEIIANEVPCTSDGLIDFRLSAGEHRISVSMIYSPDGTQWLIADLEKKPIVNIVEGETTEIRVPVRKLESLNPTKPTNDRSKGAKDGTSDNAAAPTQFPPNDVSPSAKPQTNTITGRCVDEQGQPLDGVKVALYRRDVKDRQLKLVREATTGADGQFAFESVVDVAQEFPEGGPKQVQSDDSILVVASAPGRVTNEFRQSATRVAFGGHATEIRMPPAAKLTGRVRGPDGEQLAGVQVSAIGRRPEGYFPAGSDYFSGTTNERGEYEIDDLAPFDHGAEQSKAEARAREIANDLRASYTPTPSVVFRHPKYAVKTSPALKIPGQLDAQLKIGATVEGRAVDGEGKPVAGAIVQLRGFSLKETVEFYAAESMSDAEGNYRLSSLPALPYSISGFAPELVGHDIEGLNVAAGAVTTAPDLVLTPGATLRIQCVDKETSEPLNLQAEGRARIVLDSTTKDGVRLQVSLDATCSRDGKATVHAPGGEWQISVLVSTHKDRPWAPAEKELEQRPNVTAVEGETVDVTVPMMQSQR